MSTPLVSPLPPPANVDAPSPATTITGERTTPTVIERRHPPNGAPLTAPSNAERRRRAPLLASRSNTTTNHGPRTLGIHRRTTSSTDKGRTSTKAKAVPLPSHSPPPLTAGTLRISFPTHPPQPSSYRHVVFPAGSRLALAQALCFQLEATCSLSSLSLSLLSSLAHLHTKPTLGECRPPPFIHHQPDRTHQCANAAASSLLHLPERRRRRPGQPAHHHLP
jgi:hypothetical protein